MTLPQDPPTLAPSKLGHRCAAVSNTQDRPEPAPAADPIGVYYANPARRPGIVRALFNRTARHYNLINHIFSLGSGAWYRRSCLRKAGVAPGMTVVDVAVGTGLLAREARRLMQGRGTLIGIDLSEAMLAVARQTLDIPLVQGTAEALPLAADMADVVTMGYALRHIADLPAAFSEALRILRPGGTIVLLEISAPRKKLNRAIAAAYIGRLIPLLARLTTRDERARTLMRYHWETIVNYLPPEAVLEAMGEAGFKDLRRWTELDLFHCYAGAKAGA